jgi:hypothetical protein
VGADRTSAAGRGLRAALLAAALAAGLGGTALLGGCVAYPVGTPVPAGPSTFDRAFDAASGAMSANGLALRTADRGSGVIVGTGGGLTLTASVRPQPDGTTRVEFNQSGGAGQDPNLVNRVVADYNRRMGR